MTNKVDFTYEELEFVIWALRPFHKRAVWDMRNKRDYLILDEAPPETISEIVKECSDKSQKIWSLIKRLERLKRG